MEAILIRKNENKSSEKSPISKTTFDLRHSHERRHRSMKSQHPQHKPRTHLHSARRAGRLRATPRGAATTTTLPRSRAHELHLEILALWERPAVTLSSRVVVGIRRGEGIAHEDSHGDFGDLVFEGPEAEAGKGVGVGGFAGGI
jgi:hypothetical protein